MKALNAATFLVAMALVTLQGCRPTNSAGIRYMKKHCKKETTALFKQLTETPRLTKAMIALISTRDKDADTTIFEAHKDKFGDVDDLEDVEGAKSIPLRLAVQAGLREKDPSYRKLKDLSEVKRKSNAEFAIKFAENMFDIGLLIGKRNDAENHWYKRVFGYCNICDLDDQAFGVVTEDIKKNLGCETP